jgi:subtilisin family serine protease
VLVLRAGTSRGLLEEDDVAAAVLYAVEMGARVVNMSFGDTEEAPFLDDVLRYAHSRGLVLVAAAGNDGNTTPYFPAALGETISVGASDESDARAGCDVAGARAGVRGRRGRGTAREPGPTCG